MPATSLQTRLAETSPTMSQNFRRQQGATLVIALIMLVMVTLIVVGAMSLSLTNLRVAGNMQFRTEALSAASSAIEQVIRSDFTTNPVAQTINVDVNRDGTADYSVIVQPSCISIRVVPSSELVMPADSACVAGSSMSLIPGQSLCADTRWDVAATVQDGGSGAITIMHQGMKKRIELTVAQSECD